MQVLDHGYVNLVESWGSDERIIEAARMSTKKGFEGWTKICPDCNGAGTDEEEFADFLPDTLTINCRTCHGMGEIAGDTKLLRYLYEHKHMTPFEMGGLVLEVQAPIFVFREWHRHRTQSYNELSSRYTPIPDVNYIPSVERLMMNAGGTNKQAGTIKGADILTEERAAMWRGDLEDAYKQAEIEYQVALSMGVPKELARILLPVGRYSRMRASANLRNWLGFLTLRLDESAQWEIRQYAEAVADILKPLFPRTYELFSENS